MYWTLELAISLEDAPWPATKEELIDYAMRSGAPMEVIENLNEIEDEGDVYESIEEIWPDYPSKEDFLFNEDEQVAVHAIVRTGVAFAANGELHAFANACRDIDVDDLVAFHDAFTAAMGAFFLDDGALSTAGGTHRGGLHLSEEAVDGLHHLAATVAGGTGLCGAIL